MELIRSEHVYRGRVVSLRLDDVRLEDGRVVHWEVVEHAPSVTIVPVRADGTVVLIEQYRHPTGGVLLETPAGNVGPGETPAEAAQRELAEEIGCRAEELIPL
ncbi:MAG: NUDIX hydrolase, partial [Armatimonadetes bacterium]|nr:NUDIX hydrolase [Armatimonadota bacterium]